MSMKAKAPRSGAPLSLLLQGLILAAGAQFACVASAAEPAQTGLLKLPNVKIQNATPQQIAAVQARSAATAAGIRAYKDKDSGRMREQTPEEMIEEAAASVPMPSEPVAVISPAKGGIAALLDESFMTDAVVTRNSEGKLQMECVTGKGAAGKALANRKSVKEHSHDR